MFIIYIAAVSTVVFVFSPMFRKWSANIEERQIEKYNELTLLIYDTEERQSASKEGRILPDRWGYETRQEKRERLGVSA